MYYNIMSINISKISLCIQKKMDEFDNFLDRKITEIFFINVQNKCTQTENRYDNCCNRCLNYHYRCNNQNNQRVVYNDSLISTQPSSINDVNINNPDDLEAGYLTNTNLFYPVLNNNLVKNPLTYGTNKRKFNCEDNLNNTLVEINNTYDDKSDDTNDESEDEFDDKQDNSIFTGFNSKDELTGSIEKEEEYSSSDEYDKLEDYDEQEEYDKISDEIYNETDEEVISILNDKKDD